MTIYERGDGQLQLCMTVDDRVWENNYRLYRDRLQSYLAERGFMASAAGDGATGAPEARATPAGDRDPLAVLKDERAREIVRLRNEGYTWQEIGDAPKIMLSWGRVKNILTDIRREHPDLVKDFRRVKS